MTKGYFWDDLNQSDSNLRHFVKQGLFRDISLGRTVIEDSGTYCPGFDCLSSRLGKVEVKEDFRAGETGNVFLEKKCIEKTESLWWVYLLHLEPGFVNPYFLSIDTLINWLNQSRFKKIYHPNEGILVPLDEFKSRGMPREKMPCLN